MLGREPDERRRQHRPARLVLLTEHEQIGPRLPTQQRPRGRLDLDRIAHPRLRGPRRFGIVRDRRGEVGVVGQIRRHVALEHDRRREAVGVLGVHRRAHAGEHLVAFAVGQPADLEGVVALDHAVGVVINCLTGAVEQTGGRVVLAQNQVTISLRALQRDAHRHLPHRAPRQRVGPAQRLRPEQHVHAERPPLSHQAVQQQPRVLGDLVVFGEELLKLVDHQQRPGHRLVPPGLHERRACRADGLHAEIAEQITPPLQLVVEPVQHAEPELTVALHRDRPSVRQARVHAVARVGLELHALFEVHQIELELVRAVPQRPGRDHHVQKRRLARARLARDQHVLARALAQRELLELGRPRPPERDAQLVGARRFPRRGFLRREHPERHLDLARLERRLADHVEQPGRF